MLLGLNCVLSSHHFEPIIYHNHIIVWLMTVMSSWCQVTLFTRLCLCFASFWQSSWSVMTASSLLTPPHFSWSSSWLSAPRASFSGMRCRREGTSAGVPQSWGSPCSWFSSVSSVSRTTGAPVNKTKYCRLLQSDEIWSELEVSS